MEYSLNEAIETTGKGSQNTQLFCVAVANYEEFQEEFEQQKMSFEVKGFTVELKPTSKRWHLVLFRSDRTPDADATETFSTRCLVTAEVTDKNIND